MGLPVFFANQDIVRQRGVVDRLVTSLRIVLWSLVLLFITWFIDLFSLLNPIHHRV